MAKFCEEKKQNKSETSSLKILNMKPNLFKTSFQIPSNRTWITKCFCFNSYFTFYYYSIIFHKLNFLSNFFRARESSAISNNKDAYFMIFFKAIYRHFYVNYIRLQTTTSIYKRI